MTKNFVQELNITDVLSGGADEEARRLLEVWYANNGILCDELISLAPLLLIFDGSMTTASKPEMLLCGEQSLAAQLLGNEWAEQPESAVSTLNKQYINLIEQGYKRTLQTNRPTFELVSTSLQHSQTTDLKLRYQRLILPFQTSLGAPFLLSYSHDVGTHPRLTDPKPNGKSPQSLPRRNMGQTSPSRLARSSN
ncbi:hypothetical protein [Roseibium sp. TrichSKD4]|uniref:hypothetical protein n=1 Tax=Roseibium sp. TrichSKD4 TaxID=744980 RepID=UPI00111288B5|nr:hypothetical protein [Roseibium sp. TrichSKD4]